MLAMQAEPRAKFPEKLDFLFEPARYKVAHGGRGGAKSWGFARALLIIGAQSRKRIICAREIQKSIAESVHELLKNQVAALGLSHFYRVTDEYIEGKNGTLFTFHGLKHNVRNIKSLEGCDICWVEEAEMVSNNSWETLIPTIRKDGSEIWVTFNPDMETDDTYKRFITKSPSGAKAVRIGWRDNPWFPKVLEEERKDLLERDPEEYLTVWEGQTRKAVKGAIYANELIAAAEEKRLATVPYNLSKPVHTFWDLGKADMTAIWFVQLAPFQYQIVDYYENQGFLLPHYIKKLKEKPYQYGTMWLPHDAEEERIGQAQTVTVQMRAAFSSVRITPKLGIAEGINAARSIFNMCWFDSERCADGINVLRHYQYDVDPATKEYSKYPLHNWASHGADAFRYMAVAMKPEKPKGKGGGDEASAGGWMA